MAKSHERARVTKSADALVDEARQMIERVSPQRAIECQRAGALLIDIRPAQQRATHGVVPGALIIERNVLEWRCDPTSEARLPQAVDDDVEWLVLCSEGYTSSLAAASLIGLGLHRATDVVGGYQALRSAGVLERLSESLVGAQQRP
jgi:rhodanese-related sulfurtransferase